MKVCFLVEEHPFLDARIFKKEAKSLFKKGYEVTMIVPKIGGYLFDIDGKKFTDRFQSHTFIHEGIKIITYERFYRSKSLNNLNYNIKSGKHQRFLDPLTKLGLAEEADIYHAHEFFSLYSGIGIKRALKSLKRKAVKLIYDSHELDPDPHTTAPRIKTIMMEMLQSMLTEVDYIITVSESIKSWYQGIAPLVPIDVIYNSPPLFPHYSPKKYDKKPFLAAYEGIIHKTKGNFKKLIEITELCNKEIDFTFRIIGGAKEWDRNDMFIPSRLTDKIEVLGWIDYNSLPNVLLDVDLGWIDFQPANSLNHRFAMPNKFFSYLNSGVPVLVNKCDDMEKFIQTYQCGYVVNKMHATAEDYASIILSLCKDKNQLEQASRNARKILESTYHWGKMEKRLFDVYEWLQINS